MIQVSKNITSEYFHFELSVIDDDALPMLSLEITYEDKTTDFWDNGSFIVGTVYPKLRAHLAEGKPLKFEGAKDLLDRFNRAELFELYEILVAADALGWMKGEK